MIRSDETMQTKRRTERDTNRRQRNANKSDYECKPRSRTPEEREAVTTMKKAAVLKRGHKANMDDALRSAIYHCRPWKYSLTDTAQTFAARNAISVDDPRTETLFQLLSKMAGTVMQAGEYFKAHGRASLRWGKVIVEVQPKSVQVFL